MKKYLVAVVGPTASGKTNASIAIATRLRTHILSADSRQFYREMNIGTAKPAIVSLAKVPHHFINHCSIHQPYSAGQFELDALKLLHSVFMHHHNAVIIGGAGLFIRAVTDGMDEIPKVRVEVKDEIIDIYHNKGLPVLQQLLKESDPEYFAQVDINNSHRLIRALSVIRSSGIPFSKFRTGEKKKRHFLAIKIGIQMEKELLHQKISDRVDQMIRDGLTDEAKSLFSFRHLVPLQTVGYQEMFDHLDGKISLLQAVDLIKKNTRHYAKRQMTWFRKEKDIEWFQPDQLEKMYDYIANRMSTST